MSRKRKKPGQKSQVSKRARGAVPAICPHGRTAKEVALWKKFYAEDCSVAPWALANMVEDCPECLEMEQPPQAGGGRSGCHGARLAGDEEPPC
jgi:hypothetical protein